MGGLLRRGRRRIGEARLGTWAIAVVGLALLVRIPFFLGVPNPVEPGDEQLYVDLATGLGRGDGFDSHYLTPGYPAFVALLQPLPGRTADAVSAVQHLLGAALVGAVLWAGWRYFGRAAAVLAATLAALSPLLAWTEHAVAADALFGVVAFAGAVALAEAVRRRPEAARWLVLAGALFGAAAWIKPAGLFLLAAAPLALVLSARDARWVLRGSAIVCGTLVLLVAPWLVRNAVRFDFVGMTNQGGQTLFNRAFEHDRLPVPTDARWGPLAERMQRTAPDHGPGRLPYGFEDALVARGLTHDRAFEVEGDLAQTAIRRHPGDYAAGTWRSLRELAGYVRADESQEPYADRDRIRGSVARALASALWGVATVLTDLWWVLSLFTLAGLVVLRSRDERARAAGAAFVSVWLAVALGTALTHGGLPRYAVQVAPLAWLLGSAGAVVLLSALWRAAREG